MPEEGSRIRNRRPGIGRLHFAGKPLRATHSPCSLWVILGWGRRSPSSYATLKHVDRDRRRRRSRPEPLLNPPCRRDPPPNRLWKVVDDGSWKKKKKEKGSSAAAAAAPLSFSFFAEVDFGYVGRPRGASSRDGATRGRHAGADRGPPAPRGPGRGCHSPVRRQRKGRATGRSGGRRREARHTIWWIPDRDPEGRRPRRGARDGPRAPALPTQPPARAKHEAPAETRSPAPSQGPPPSPQTYWLGRRRVDVAGIKGPRGAGGGWQGPIR